MCWPEAAHVFTLSFNLRLCVATHNHMLARSRACVHPEVQPENVSRPHLDPKRRVDTLSWTCSASADKQMIRLISAFPACADCARCQTAAAMATNAVVLLMNDVPWPPALETHQWCSAVFVV